MLRVRFLPLHSAKGDLPVKKRHVLFAALVGVTVLWLSPPVLAGSHLWVINEVFSNADGTVQFVEMHVP